MALEGTILGHYRLVKQVGGGGMSEVYLADDVHLQGRQVAIKLVRTEVTSDLGDDPSHSSGHLFQREARVITMLDHPHILPLYDFGEERTLGVTLTYIVMPYRPEGSLANWIKQHGNRGRPLPQEVAEIISQAADALQYAHNQGVVHRDVKPTNFLIQSNTANPAVPYLQLADFGIAKMNVGTTSLSQHVRGTPNYMAPEQWQGHPDAATDQYALAIMAYELLTGRIPFVGEMMQLLHQHLYVQPQPPSTFNPSCNRDIDTVILHALEKAPQNRFKSVSAFANAFKQAAVPRTETSSIRMPQPQSRQTVQPNQLIPTILPSLPPSNPNTPQTAYPNPNPFTPVPPMNNSSTTLADDGTVPAKPWNNYRQPEQLPPPPPPLPDVNASKQSWFKSRIVIIALVALALLIILSGVIFGASTIATNNAHTDATSTAQSNASATADTHATATTIAQATAAAQATARVINANRDPYSHGRLTLLDPLNGGSSDSNWSSKPGCGFIRGAYHTSETQAATFNSCYLTQPTFSNFTLETVVTIIKGDCGGIVFRANSSTGQQYLFRICQDNQHYYLYTCNGFRVQCQSITSGFAIEINAGLGQGNKIAVVANGSGMDLYINGSKVDSATDSTFSSGNIGMVASEINNHTEAVYTGLRVWTL